MPGSSSVRRFAWNWTLPWTWARCKYVFMYLYVYGSIYNAYRYINTYCIQLTFISNTEVTNSMNIVNQNRTQEYIGFRNKTRKASIDINTIKPMPLKVEERHNVITSCAALQEKPRQWLKWHCTVPFRCFEYRISITTFLISQSGMYHFMLDCTVSI